MGDRKSTIEKESIEYTDLIIQEIKLSLHFNAIPLQTIYFGGGTPSLMPPRSIQKIIETLRDRVGISNDAEVTLEMDPGTFDLETLKNLSAAGINRVSLGVQSFHDGILEKCGRAHRLIDVENSIHYLRQSDINNFSMDLISSLPTLTMEIWEDTLHKAIACQPNHISVYDLQIEEHTAFHRWYSPGVFPMPTDHMSADMFRKASKLLSEYQYEHYEVSNYAKSGYRSRHNQKYWNCEPVYGFGMSASSFVDGRRYKRPDTIEAYKCYVESLEITRKDSESGGPMLERDVAAIGDPGGDLEEVLMLAMRTAAGANFGDIKRRFPQFNTNVVEEAILPFIETGLAEWITLPSGDRVFRLTDPEGFLFSNEVISSLFAAIS